MVNIPKYGEYVVRLQAYMRGYYWEKRYGKHYVQKMCETTEEFEMTRRALEIKRICNPEVEVEIGEPRDEQTQKKVNEILESNNSELDEGRFVTIGLFDSTGIREKYSKSNDFNKLKKVHGIITTERIIKTMEDVWRLIGIGAIAKIESKKEEQNQDLENIELNKDDFVKRGVLISHIEAEKEQESDSESKISFGNIKKAINKVMGEEESR